MQIHHWYRSHETRSPSDAAWKVLTSDERQAVRIPWAQLRGIKDDLTLPNGEVVMANFAKIYALPMVRTHEIIAPHAPIHCGVSASLLIPVRGGQELYGEGWQAYASQHHAGDAGLWLGLCTCSPHDVYCCFDTHMSPIADQILVLGEHELHRERHGLQS